MKKRTVILQPLFLSEEKILEIRSELNKLENIVFPNLRKRLADAYEDGDIPENNPYLTANLELQEALNRKNELRKLLARAKLYKKDPQKKHRFQLGDTVKIAINNGPPKVITLVSSEEADPSNNKISIDSPIGTGILESQGDSITIATPNSEILIEILQ